jgi:hypothetical protein
MDLEEIVARSYSRPFSTFLATLPFNKDLLNEWEKTLPYKENKNARYRAAIIKMMEKDIKKWKKNQQTLKKDLNILS